MADACPPQRLPTGRQEAKEGQSVDPLAAKYPGWSPYNYCADDPMNYIDKDGRDWKKAFSHFLNCISNAKETMGGLSLIIGGGYTVLPSGGTSTIGIAVGIEFTGHGIVGLGMNLWNSAVETTRSIIGDETVLNKLPSGYFESVAIQVFDGDEKSVAIGQLIDIMNTTIASGFDPGAVGGSYLRGQIDKILEVLNDTNDAQSLYEIYEKYKKEIDKFLEDITNENEEE
ncbi:MAG: hypothetical protein GXX85_10500 [Ignavibacteria bacterium]|nr:hypothetical protein [Ignavibacteria bacterium]